MKNFLLVLAIIGVAAVGSATCYYNWKFPYGYTHCCDIGLKFALDEYAEQHGGAFPTGEATAEASLSLLYPGYAHPGLLTGKTVPLATVQRILEGGGALGPETCGWHYTPGLTLNDDGKIALFWDKAGLGHFAERLGEGEHVVILLDGQRQLIAKADWPKFLEDQDNLLKNTKSATRNQGPMLTAKVRLPSGELVESFNGPWRLDDAFVNASASGTGSTSGPNLSAESLRWYRHLSSLNEGKTTMTLHLTGAQLRSKPVTVEIKNGKASPSAVIFEMEPMKTQGAG